MAFQDTLIVLGLIYFLFFILIITFILFNNTFKGDFEFKGELKSIKDGYIKGLDFVIPFIFISLFVISLITSYGVSSKPYYFVFAFLMLGVFYFLVNIMYTALHYVVEDLGDQKEAFIQTFPISHFMISNFPVFGVVFVLGTLAISYINYRS